MKMTAAASSRRPPQKLASRRARPGVTPGGRSRWRRGRGDVTVRVERDAVPGTPSAGRAAEPAAPGPASGGAAAEPPGALGRGVPVSGGAAPGPEAPGGGVSGAPVSGAAAGACPAPGSQSAGRTEAADGAPRGGVSGGGAWGPAGSGTVAGEPRAFDSARWEPAPDPEGPAPLTSRGREPPGRGRGMRTGRLGLSGFAG